jgi:hypothetical protein
MTPTARLARINALNDSCTRLQERIERRRLRRESISYDQAKLVRERMKQIRAEIRLEKESRKVA